jgi:hypothetical protein
MNEQTEELISAAIDGERVDVAALRQALATSGGRDALASFVLLRAAAAADHDDTDERLHEAMAKPLHPRRRMAFRGGPQVPAGLAASIAVLAVAASFWLGVSWRAPALPPPAAPAVREAAAPAPLPPPTMTPAVAQNPVPPCAPQPPTPTLTVKYVRGVDWRSGS